MMSLKLQVIIILALLVTAGLIVNMVRKQKIDLRYALGWILICIPILILTVFPSLITQISNLLGIASPVNMLFFVGFIFVIIIIFTLSVSVSHLATKLKMMAQEIAILKHELNEKSK